RPFEGATDIPMLADFVWRTALQRQPGASYYHPGDITWQLYRAGPGDDVRLWFHHESIIAFAIFEPPLTFQFDVDGNTGNQTAIVEDLLNWAEGRRMAVAGDAPIPASYAMLGSGVATTA